MNIFNKNIIREEFSLKKAKNYAQDGYEEAQAAADRMADISERIMKPLTVPKFPYTRPEFLYFCEEEVSVSADQNSRPVIVPKYPQKMPFFAGYAECINAGRTELNEDQTACKILQLSSQSHFSSRSATSARLSRKDYTKHSVQRNEIYCQSINTHSKRTSSECRLPETEKFDLDTCRFFERPKRLHVSNQRRRSDDDDLLVDVRLGATPTHEKSAPSAIKIQAGYFGVFDGHNGCGAAVFAANCLHEHIKQNLNSNLDTIAHLDRQEQLLGCELNGIQDTIGSPNGKLISADSLVVGALESAFVQMDAQLADEGSLWRIPGGCTACVCLFLLGKLYVANAGDCRALLVTRDKCEQLSNDHTPDADRKRIQTIAYQQPGLLSNTFSRLEYNRCLTRRDLKKKVLYRDWYMDGWGVKYVRDEDLRHPLISDGPIKSRLLHTLGVARGFGDHDLVTVERILIKPFLSAVPEVKIVNLATEFDDICEDDVILLASDGLFDAMPNKRIAEILRQSLRNSDENEAIKYTLAAQELVIAARGDPHHDGRWRLDPSIVGRNDNASTDDISALVIPLKYALEPSIDDDIDMVI